MYFMDNIWQETFSVGFRDIDPSDRLTLGAIFDYFQEASINHAENLGVGRASMAQTGQIWILSRISVVLERRPRYRETITLRSWPRGTEKLFAIRDYDIQDASATPLVRGRSAWLILDMEKHRPLRPQAVVDKLPLNQGLDALHQGVPGLTTRVLTKVGERRAAYSDIDYNRHVNNARYIQWIQDIIDPELLEHASHMRLDVNYLQEIKGGETTELWSAPLDDSGFAFEGRRHDTGQAVFRAELGIHAS
jgi:acyl-ACP thioesterase